MAASALDDRSNRGQPVALIAEAPLAAAAVRWRSGSGEQVTVIAKLSFAIREGECVLRSSAEPIALGDQHAGGRRGSSVAIAGDCAPFKRAPEVLLVGKAFAAGAVPCTKIACRLKVGSVDKRWEAWGPRVLDGHDARTLEAISEAPLCYEAAAGGPDSENPVGVLAPQYGGASLGHLPSLQPSGFSPRPGAPLPCVGLGPVAETWPSRQRRLRPEDRAWLAEPSLRELPSGFDGRFFCAAPPDQLLEHPVREGEPIVLEGLTPCGGRVETRLPSLSPRLLLQGGFGDAPVLVADTLVVDTERQVISVVYRARVPLRPGEGLRLRVALSQRGREIDPARLEQDPVAAVGARAAWIAPLPARAWAAAAEGLPSGADDRSAGATEDLGELQDETGEYASRAESGFFGFGEPAGPAPRPEEPFEEWMQDEATQRTPELALRRIEPAPSADQPSGEPGPGDEVAAEASADDRGSEPGAEAQEAALIPLGDAPLAAFSGLQPASDRKLARLLSAFVAGPKASLPELVVAGRLTPTLDAVAELTTLARLAAPYAPREPRVQQALGAAREALEHAVHGASIVERTRADLTAALALLPLKTPDLMRELRRALVRARSYELLTVFGERHARCELELREGGRVVTYLPERVAHALPLFESLEVVARVRVRPREDQEESSPICLQCLALARLA